MKHDYNAIGVDMTSTGNTSVGYVQAHEWGGTARVEKVVLNPSAFNGAFTFNVVADGSDLFSATQAPAGPSAEEFIPDQNQYITGGTPLLEVSVDASATAGTADVGILLDDQKGEP